MRYSTTFFLTISHLVAMATICASRASAAPDPSNVGQVAEGDEEKVDIARRRMEVMASRMESIGISSSDASIPGKLQSTPLFRYDDETRGYVDGTVWRLGDKGRPLAIITAELHPNYPGTGSAV